MSRANYTRDEEARLRRQLRAEGGATCPRCDMPMERREVPPKSEVAYVRDRVWLVCGGCRRSLVVDRKRIE